MPDKKAAVVLAAGKGQRMKSDLPKVLHEINGKPMIKFVIETLLALKFEKIVVVIGYKGELVEEALKDYPVKFVWQKEQLGTGHAVMMAKEELVDFDGTTLIALGDVPFLSTQTVENLTAQLGKSNAKASCLSAILDDPTGYGRIVRDGQSEFIREIVEHKDASDEIRKIAEINTGTFCFDNKLLFETLENINNDNSQGEYYLTDCVKLLFENKLPVAVTVVEDADEGLGVNSQDQLAEMGEKFKDRL